MGIATAIAIGSIASAAASSYAAHRASEAQENATRANTDATNHAADLQSHGNDEALAFQRQQAAADQQRWQQTQQANYAQYLARYNAVRAFAGQSGLNLPEAPAAPSYYNQPIAPQAPAGNGLPDGKPVWQGDKATGGPVPGPSSGAPAGPQGGGGPMPQGIDPRFAALYQRYGVTPGARGSGPSDWQYYQNDAVRNANGDVNYVLGRLEQDLSGGGGGAPGGQQRQAVLPSRSVANYLPQGGQMGGVQPFEGSPAGNFRLRGVQAYLRDR